MSEPQASEPQASEPMSEPRIVQVRRWLPFGAIVVVILLTGIFLGAPGGGGVPLDPENPKGLGTKGIVEVLRLLDADVRVSRAPLSIATTDTAVIFEDDLDRAGIDAAQAFVDDGGTLLLADPFSVLNPFGIVGQTGVGFFESSIERDCDVPALRDVERVSAQGAAVLEPDEGAVGCFPRDGGSWLVAMTRGDGNLVVVGGAGALVNQQLDEADNAMLVATILAPRPGTRVTIVQPPLPGEAGRSLIDLIAPDVRTALLQLGIAFVFVALWRARRLGGPVLEPQPVELAGSELVLAVGHLLQRAGGVAQAVGLLRADLRRHLTDRLGLPRSIDEEQLAAIAAARTRVDSDAVLSALTRPIAGDTELVQLAHLIESVRLEVNRAQIDEPLPTTS
jgi:hypothetical protein